MLMSSNPFEGRVMLRPAEVDEMLGLPVGTMSRWLRNGIAAEIPYVQYGPYGKVFDKEEILQWWESKKRRPAPIPPPTADPNNPSDWLLQRSTAAREKKAVEKK